MSKLFTATIDYFATGEGRTLHFFAAYAEDKEAFLVMMKEVINPYFVQGAEVFAESLPPKADSAASILLSDSMRRFLSQDGPMWMQTHLTLHFNLS